MKPTLRQLLALSGLLLGFATPLSAQMNYQGRLTDVNGAAVAGATATIRFSLHDAETGGGKVWGDFDVNADLLDGRFNVVIGPRDATNRSINDVFTKQLYLQITLMDDQDPPQPIVPALPRQTILNAPYALGAFNAVNAQTALTAQSLSNGSGSSPLNVDFTNGRVGVGTTSPNSRLHVNGDGIFPSLRVQVNGASKFIVAPNGGTSIGAFEETPPVDGLFVQGNVGIGTVAAGFPLTFDTTFGDKISLFGESGNSIGFGVQSSRLQIHTDTIGSDIVFGYGSSASMTETMRIRGNGIVGIGTTNPRGKLEVIGDIRLGTSGQYQVPGGEERLRIVRGTIRADDGSPQDGSGYTSTRNSVGRYTVTFTVPFGGRPTITATAENSIGTTFQDQFATLQTVSNTSVVIDTRDADDGGFEDGIVHFIAIGPR